MIQYFNGKVFRDDTEPRDLYFNGKYWKRNPKYTEHREIDLLTGEIIWN